MSKPIRVKSTAHMPFMISEPHPDPEKPGMSPTLRTAIVKPGVSHVDADVYKAWAGTKPSHVTDGIVTEMKDDELDMSFGWEPALETASKDDATAASEGSTLKASGPVSAADMKPTSTAPADDSPRSQTASPMAKPTPVPPQPAPK